MTSRFLCLVLVAACADVENVAETTQSLVDADFIAQGLAGKCISVDAKSFRLGIRTCASTTDQRLRVIEYGERLVELRIHDWCVQPLHGFPVQGVVLETAPCNGKPAQRWMLDGDSIRMGPQPGDPFPDLLISVQNHSGIDGSPLSLEGRRFDESDYWELTAADRRGPQYPTSGFVEVATALDLGLALDAATPGTVVDIEAGVSIDLFECGRTGPGPYDHTAPRLRVGPRVTLRSGGKHAGRRPVHAGGGARLRYSPFLYCLEVANPTAIVVDGMGARVTGFRLEGLSIERQGSSAPRTYGIFVSNMDAPFADTCDPLKAGTPRKVEIDHMELTGWKDGAVAVWGASMRVDDNGTAPTYDWNNGTWVGGNWTPLAACRCSASSEEGVSALVARNYIHHNTEPDGYGVLVSDDGHATIAGNTFLHNRHAISGEGTSGVRYYASANLIHSHGEDNQDFDVHGSGPCGGGARGGVAGERIDVVDNTFLGNDRNNLYLRGQSCLGARYMRNVTRQQQEDGYLELESTSQAVRVARCPWEGPINIDVHDNAYEIDDPTAHLGVGDFNGDGRDDVFVATGAAFYVSFDGQAAWTLRAVSRERLEDLLFADLDGDQRTDILRNAPNGEGIQILFGGEGDWTPLRPDVRLPDLLAGDFDGDGRDDLISTDGVRWRFSRSGTAPWTTIRNETRRAPEFRVGRIDAGVTDDVFGVFPNCSGSQDCWAFFPSGTSLTATLMGPALAGIDQLSIADANNDGKGDVVRTAGTLGFWQISVSLGGASPWTTWASSEAKPGALGRFGGSTVALVWKSLAWRSVVLGQASQPLAWFEMF